MAKLAAAFGSSHSVMLAAQLEDWLTKFRVTDLRAPFFDREGRPIQYADVLARAPTDIESQITPERITQRFHDVQAAMARMKEEIASARLDVLVVVGDDQHELFLDDHMPAIGIYYGNTIRNAKQTPVPEGEWYKRAQMRRREETAEVDYACHPRLATHFIEGLIERDFEVSAVRNLKEGQFEGHAYSFVHRWYLRGTTLPIVPIFLNTYNPPNPPHPRRCLKFGQALRQLIDNYPEPLRVGVMASGGLSHFIVDETLDHGVIDAIRRKDNNFLANLDPRILKAGSSEIRSWIVAAGAAHDLNLDWVSYTPGYRTPAGSGTGLGFARWR
jgi:Catalytic LigB subunit of aromatic ring-opening dioxygenase